MRYINIKIQGVDEEADIKGIEYELRMGMGWIGLTPPEEFQAVINNYLAQAESDITRMNGEEQ